ncbi:PAS domain S-box protein [Fulvivirga sp.]|uniref:PAS domain S-box protein n=1 Tax=Fulvivirga sp. TaxID=1931237 RepID=UPI0032EF42C2
MALGKNLETKETKSETTAGGNGKKATPEKSKSTEFDESEVLKEVLEQALDSIITINSDKEIIFYNSSAEQMFGYSKEEVMGQNVKMIVPIDHQKNHDKYVDNNIQTGENKVVGKGRDLEMVRKGGARFWGNLTLSKVKIGKKVQYTAFVKDITEERESKIKSEQLQLAVDSGWASIEFEPDGTILSANKNFVKALGYNSQDEMVGKHHKIFCDPEYAQSNEYKAFWNNLAKGEIQSGEFPRITPKGETVWINASYTPVKDAEGNVVKVIKIATEITDMVAARAKGENIQAAVDAGWAYIQFKPDGTIIEANKAFVSTMGYNQSSEINGQHHRIFVDPSYASSSEYSQFWKDLASGKVQGGEYARVRKDGQDVWLQAAYAPIKDENGNVVSVIKIATDISKVKFPVLAVRDIVNKIAEGDLTNDFTISADGYVKEMGDALNKALENLNTLLSTIDQAASQVANSAESMLERSQSMKSNTTEVASAISQMSKGAQDQASKTDESSKLAEEVMTSAVEMEKKANLINKAAESGQKSSESGLKIIKTLVDNMLGISTSANLTSDSIKVLTERAEEIARTLNVITDIAAQTNLLALNAAIEAARAGDAGRGFAVVAEEIRKLAEDSRKSAVDIEKIIKDVQKDTQSASKAIETMEVSVKQGNTASVEAETIFQEIAGSSEETFKYSLEIQEATSGQKKSIDTVVKNIEQIVVVAEETAAGTQEVASSSQELDSSMEEIAAASDQLASVATELQAGVNQFKLKKR